MRTILYILQKEFIQVFRNKTMVPIIFLMPLMQLIILVYAASLEMKDIKMEVVDFDHSSISREIISSFQASPFYTITGFRQSVDEAEKSLIDNMADVVMVIPAGIEKDLLNGVPPAIQFQIDAINGMTAGLVNSYSSMILLDVNTNLSAKLMHFSDQMPNIKQIEIRRRFWYNPGLNYRHYMVPGILVILVTVIGMFLTALNIVREKEIGTIEQINVTPIKKYQFMMGKLLPFLVIALLELALGLTLGWVIFGLPFRGSLLVLFAFAFLYLILVLGFGLLLSVVSNTQQQVMFMSFFFLLVFILMSGLFTPIETMPHWAQEINIINPFAYFMKVNRMILLKGSGFADLKKEFLYIGIYGVVVLSFAVKYYRKRV